MIATIAAETADFIIAENAAGERFELAYWAVPASAEIGDAVALELDADGDLFVSATRETFADVNVADLAIPALSLWLHLYPEAPQVARASILEAINAKAVKPQPFADPVGLYADDVL